MLKPYYQDSACTIYLGDCREVIPELGQVDLVLTDPPYPNLKGGKKIGRGSVAKSYRDTYSVGTPWGNDISGVTLACEKAHLGAFAFCTHHSVSMMAEAMRGEAVALITWYRRNSTPPVQNAPHFVSELIWAFKMRPGLEWRRLRTVYDIPKLQAGCMATERIVDEVGGAVHPTQKPLRLIMELLKVGGDSVLDPFMGTGTTLRAAKDLGRTAIGIEMDERYCEIAANRLAQEVLTFA